jgi:hypothetical protein
MGASNLLQIKKPLHRPHFRARRWGLSLEFVRRRVNKKALQSRPIIGFWKILEVYMVEAAGIEPASANPLPLDLHA